MPVDYKKLWMILLDRKITKSQFRKISNLSSATLTKLNRNEYVSMEVLVKICFALECNIGDIVDVIK